MFPVPLHIYFEIAALVSSILFWRNLSHTRLRLFLPFLAFIVLAELTGRYLSKELRQPNAWLYNFVVPLEYLFYSIMFYLHYKRKTNLFLAKFFLILFPIYVLISLIIKGVYYFDTGFLLIGSFMMMILSLLYFFEIYSQSSDIPIWKTPMFWITVGILLFNAGEFSYNLLSKFFISNKMDMSLKTFRSINNKLILILYSSFIIAFICQKITEKYKRE